MPEVTIAIEAVRSGVALLSDAIGLVRKTKDILPDSAEKEVIEQSLAEADKASKLAESQIAQALGYTLCQCTFPPQIMLSKGFTKVEHHHEEEFVCPNCNKSSIEPPSDPLNFSGWNGP